MYGPGEMNQHGRINDVCFSQCSEPEEQIKVVGERLEKEADKTRRRFVWGRDGDPCPDSLKI
jgi:hypothetical protein